MTPSPTNSQEVKDFKDFIESKRYTGKDQVEQGWLESAAGAAYARGEDLRTSEDKKLITHFESLHVHNSAWANKSDREKEEHLLDDGSTTTRAGMSEIKQTKIARDRLIENGKPHLDGLVLQYAQL